MTRMHAVELVCTVALALVLLASARDILEGDAGVIQTAATVLEGTIPLEETNPLEESPGMAAAMSTLATGVASVGVNGEVCVDIPPQCISGSGGVCYANGGTASTDKKYATHLKQFCVARGAPNYAPDPNAYFQGTCIPNEPADVPSWCTWPGISCATSLTTTYVNKCGPTFNALCNTTAVTVPCASGVYIYTVHQAAIGGPRQRQGFWSSNNANVPFGDTYTTNAQCPGDTGYCLPIAGFPNSVPADKRGFGAPIVTAVLGSRYKIEVPRINTDDPMNVLSKFTCNIGVDLKPDVIRCNIP